MCQWGEGHACGGTILVGGAGEQRHRYCDSCRAFVYGDGDVPSGVDPVANRKAWDNGDESSPEDVAEEVP